MTTKHKPLTQLALGAIVAMNNPATAAQKESVADLILKIKNPDDLVRGPAWQRADKFGAAAVKPLAAVMPHPDMETARAAKRALWRIVRHAGRPGAYTEQKAVAEELVTLIGKSSIATQREFIWMLSEIGNDESVPPVAALLNSKELREDARAALQRIPGARSLAALRSALAAVPADFKAAIAVSLRRRGNRISAYPSEKLVPKKQTKVKAISNV